MPSTYTTNNGIELIATGEQSGTWGTTTNTNLELLDTALDGQVSVTLGATGSSGSPNTLPVTDGAASNGRNRLVIFGDGGDLGGTAYVQLTPNNAEKIVYVRNNLSGSRSILLFQGTYSASNDYEIPAGKTAVVFFDGAGSGAVAANIFNNAHFDAMNIVGNVVVGGTVSATGNITTSGTVEPAGDTAAGDNAAIGYTAAEGLILTGQGSTSDITFKNDADTTVFSIPTGTDDVLFPDNAKAMFGAGSDLSVYHDGTRSHIEEAGLGGLWISTNGTEIKLKQGGGVDEEMLVATPNGSVDLYYNNNLKLATTSTGIDVTGNATFADNGKAIFGAGSDLQIYHDGSHSYLYETGTGEFRIKTNGNIIQFLDNSNNYLIKATVGAEVGLYFNTAQKLATTNTGIDITGNAKFADNGQAIFGDSSDLSIEHNGTSSTITNATGTLTIQNTADDEDVDIVSDDGSGGTAVYFRADGSSGQAKLYHNNAGTGTLRLNTSSDGIDITGHCDIEGHFTASDGCTITTADNSTQLTLTSTDDDASEGPRLDLKRDSSSPAAGDLIGTIRYVGDDAGGTTTVFGEIQLEADDVTDGSEDGQMRLMVRNNGNLRNAVVIDATEVLFNQSNDDVDFRVESDTKTHALFVEGSSGNVGIGTSSPTAILDVRRGDASGKIAEFHTSTGYGIELGSSQTEAYIASGSSQALLFKTNDTSERMRIDSSGNMFVSKTASNTGTAGHELLDYGRAVHTANSTTVQVINRLTNDGDISLYQKDGTSIGALQNNGTNFIIKGKHSSGVVQVQSHDGNEDIEIGSGIIRFEASGTEKMRLIGSSGDLHVDGNVIAYSTTISDERLKEDIKPITGALDKVGQLSGYTFTYKADGKKSAGVIAQEVEAILPSAVTESTLPLKTDDDVEYKTVQYDQLHGLLIEAIKELKAEIEELKNDSTK